MLPIIIGAVSLIAYGLFDENSKPKVVKRMAKGGNVKSFEEIFEEYEENEDNNYHSENVVLLAKNFGSAEDLKLAKSILKKHESEGSLSNELNKQRSALSEKLYPKLIASKNKMAKGGNIGEELMGGQPNQKKPSGAILLEVRKNGKEIIVTEDGGKTKELYVKSNGYSGYTLHYNDNQYEFVETLDLMAKEGTTDSSDKKYSALKSGTRKSNKYAHVEMRGGRVYHRRNANQYGKAKGGKTYVENRENRADKRVYLEKGGEVDTWENILVDYGFKKSRTKLGVKFYKKGKYFASIDNRRRMVELYFEDIELYSGYSIQSLIDELDKEFKH
jgi:hypothetical protein